MGSQNLFHKRKARLAKDLKRHKAKRDSYDKVLIVCEGEKTEPNYFNDLIQSYELNTANVAIDGSCGSSPKSIFRRALDLWEVENRKGDPFDRVYCVFDRDTHDTYDETVNNIKKHKSKNIFYVATSVPCFEYWLLLHFKFTTKPYIGTKSSSAADQVIKELRKFMPDYTKTNNNIFSSLFPKLEPAKTNAAKSLQGAENSDTDNPTTHIHDLVAYLQNLKA